MHCPKPGSSRRQFTDFVPTHSLVPDLLDTFLNRVKPSSLRSFVAVEAELRARGIAPGPDTWTPHPNHTMTVHQLQKLLPTENGYLVGGRISAVFQPSSSATTVDDSDVDTAIGEQRGWLQSLRDWFASDVSE